MKSFGTFLKYARKQRNLTQEQIAERLNIVTPVLSKWENDKAVPSLDMLCRLCNTLNVSIEECIAAEIFEGERALPPENYDSEKLGETVKDLRIKNDWSQAEVGKKMFVTSQTVSKWESGGISSLEILSKLAELFALRPTELLNGLGCVQELPKKQASAEPQKKSDRFVLKITAISLAAIILICAIVGLIVGLVLKKRNTEEEQLPIISEPEPPKDTEEPAPPDEQKLSFISPLNDYGSYSFFAYDPIDGNYYSALTFVTETGTEIFAVEDGVVEDFYGLDGAPKTIFIRHTGGFISKYFYVDIADLKVGDEVKKGQQIATVSESYLLFENALLHFNLKLNGEDVNPLDYIDLPKTEEGNLQS